MFLSLWPQSLRSGLEDASILPLTSSQRNSLQTPSLLSLTWFWSLSSKLWPDDHFSYICAVPQRNGALAWFAIISFLPSHPLKDTSSFKDVCYLMRPPACNCHGNRYRKYKNVHFLELSMKPEKQLAEIKVLRGSSQCLPGCSLEMSQTVLQYSKPQLYLGCGRNLQWNASKTPTTHSLLPPTALPSTQSTERLYAGSGPAGPPLCLAIWVICSRPL